MVNGEAGGQPADVDQLSILSSAHNRFGNRDFPGGRQRTWQDVLTANEYYGVRTDFTADGPDQELRNSASIYAGDTGDIVGGSACYWSPTTTQWARVQQLKTDGTATLTNAIVTEMGAPTCWSSNDQRQIVVKTSVGINARGGVYQDAPAFVFMRLKPQRTDLAYTEIQ
jgi:hypothetical protein